MRTIVEELRPLAPGGLMLLSDAESAGVDPRAMRRATDRGELTRIRRGVYVITRDWNSLGAAEQHRTRVRATALALGGDRVFSHQSAAAIHRLPLLGSWPERVHETRPRESGGRSTPAVISHSGERDPAVRVDGLRVTSVPRTLLDLAATTSFPSSVVTMDAALHVDPKSGLSAATALDIEREIDRRGDSRGVGAGLRGFSFANGLSDTPGESLSRVRIHQLGFPAPELQCVFRDSQGRMIVDFWWREWNLIGEFDGLLKYHRALQLSGLSVADVVIAEKRREDRLRATETRPGVVRWIWDDALRGQPLAVLLREAGLPQTIRR